MTTANYHQRRRRQSSQETAPNCINSCLRPTVAPLPTVCKFPSFRERCAVCRRCCQLASSCLHKRHVRVTFPTAINGVPGHLVSPIAAVDVSHKFKAAFAIRQSQFVSQSSLLGSAGRWRNATISQSPDNVTGNSRVQHTRHLHTHRHGHRIVNCEVISMPECQSAEPGEHQIASHRPMVTFGLEHTVISNCIAFSAERESLAKF